MLTTTDIITYEEAKTIRLSKNFTLDEFLHSDIALRANISNDMPRKYLSNVQNLVTHVLQPIRDKFGRIRITSGYRSIILSLKVGSSVTSNHNFGLAADIEPIEANVTLYEVLQYIYNELQYKELIAEYFPHGWVHVAYQDGNNKQILKLKDNEHHYQVVQLDTISNIYNT